MRGDLDDAELVVGDGSAGFSGQAGATAPLRVPRDVVARLDPAAASAIFRRRLQRSWRRPAQRFLRFLRPAPAAP
jgi:hypothetical protein